MKTIEVSQETWRKIHDIVLADTSMFPTIMTDPKSGRVHVQTSNEVWKKIKPIVHAE